MRGSLGEEVRVTPPGRSFARTGSDVCPPHVALAATVYTDTLWPMLRAIVLVGMSDAWEGFFVKNHSNSNCCQALRRKTAMLLTQV